MLVTELVKTELQTTLAVVPWNKEAMDPAVLEQVYQEMDGAGLLPDIFHERMLSLQEFREFVTTVIFSLCLDGDAIAGFGWIGDISEVETHLRGWGGYALLPAYWKPQISLEFGKLGVGQWFNPHSFGLPWKPFDLVLGMTPEPNRLSRLWSTRLGFKYLARLPGYTSYRGARVDGMICQMSREDFNQKWQVGEQSAWEGNLSMGE